MCGSKGWAHSYFDRSHFHYLDAVARPRSLQAGVSDWEIIALVRRVAMLSFFLPSLLLSLLLNSFRFLLKPSGGDSIGAVRRPMLDLSMQTKAAGRTGVNARVQGCALHSALHCVDSGAARAKRLAVVDGGSAPSAPSLHSKGS
jgi:hypothetical protein